MNFEDFNRKGISIQIIITRSFFFVQISSLDRGAVKTIQVSNIYKDKNAMEASGGWEDWIGGIKFTWVR